MKLGHGSEISGCVRSKATCFSGAVLVTPAYYGSFHKIVPSGEWSLMENKTAYHSGETKGYRTPCTMMSIEIPKSNGTA